MVTPSRRTFLRSTGLVMVLSWKFRADAPEGLDPRGRIHIPIGIPDTVDTVKTFVEAEGNFSPGFGTYGIYFWLLDTETGDLAAPTMEGARLQHGLAQCGLLIPWSEWIAGEIAARTEVCQVQATSPAGPVFIVGAKVRLTNRGIREKRLALYAVLRPLGPAGGAVNRLEVDAAGDALLVDGHAALVSVRKPAGAGVLPADTIGRFAKDGMLPAGIGAQSATGDCSGALRFDWTLQPGSAEEAGFVCPVLPGRNAARHHWVDLKQNAMVDQAELNPKSGGVPQPDPGLAYLRRLRLDTLFDQATSYWSRFLAGVNVQMPDPRWGESMRAILGHAGLSMNEGAPDVAAVNYNVFNRDGMYIANIMQKSGLSDYSEHIIDYFLAHPFNGRAYPEADNPGQILWVINQHWLLTRDAVWLRRVYPNVRKLTAMIRYYRTTPRPHWVSATNLDFGEALPPQVRHELKPGRCDGFHPEYTEAFDIAGLRGAAEVAEAHGSAQDAARWRELAQALFTQYDEQFGTSLARHYGSYSVLWPCRLYPATGDKAREQFKDKGAQIPESWSYFPLATAHQGLFAGNRAAGHGTLEPHLALAQMQGWYALDEGGGSGSGGWYRARTRWPHSKERPGENRSVAMPHGWAIAEFWLLMRDSIAFEDEGRLVLFAGVPEAWFRDPRGMRATSLRTHFGALDVSYSLASGGAVLEISGSAVPSRGYILRLPAGLGATVWRGNVRLGVDPNGDCLLAPGRTRVQVRFS